MPKIILATASPYRQEAFKFLNLDFIPEPSNIKEDFEGRPNNPEELVMHLAKLKAEAVAKNHNECIVIGFDSVGWFNNSILEKPKTKVEAFERIKSMSGKNFRFITGIHMINLSKNKALSNVVTTNAEMRELTEKEITNYLDNDPKFITTCLGYDPLQEYSCSFARRIEGSYNNLTRGIPLETVIEMINKIIKQ